MPAGVKEVSTAQPTAQFEAVFVSAAHSQEGIARAAAAIGEFFAR